MTSDPQNMQHPTHLTEADSLDPQNWEALRQQGHRMLDDMIDYLSGLRNRPVWQPIPSEIRAGFQAQVPREPGSLEAAHARFMSEIVPYGVGNSHPGFMGWVQGGGSAVGMLAEMLAAGLNANVGGRNQIPIDVERQVVQWVADLLGFSEEASGLFVTGTSMANLIAVWVARVAMLGTTVRKDGIAANGSKLVAYTSAGAHGCIAQAMDLAGLGTSALRVIPMTAAFEMDMALLEEAIAKDRAAGLQPFFIAATAGSVDVGAIDPLVAIADLAVREQLWFHVDGAFGALGMLAPDIAPRLAGIERANSVALDFHKWGQVQYDAGFILMRDGALHQATFSSPVSYLRREVRGLAGGSPWPCDFGPDLSRGFRALKAWFALQVYGTDKLGQVISNTCALAQYLKQKIENNGKLELLAPVALNIVCFRHRGTPDMDDARLDRFNADLAVAIQESGKAAPSTTLVKGRLAIRAAIVNHRTSRAEIDALVDTALALADTMN